MSPVRLELNKLEIHRPKGRWKVYFILVADHPDKKDQMVLSIVPDTPILVVPSQHNVIFFEPKGNGSEGLLLLRRELPPSRELNVHFHVMHSRRSDREIGEVLNVLQDGLGKDASGFFTEMLGSTSPWLAIAKTGLPLVGRLLANIPDRNLGFVSMFERFGKEFEKEVEIDRESRGGHVTVVYTWAVA